MNFIRSLTIFSMKIREVAMSLSLVREEEEDPPYLHQSRGLRGCSSIMVLDQVQRLNHPRSTEEDTIIITQAQIWLDLGVRQFRIVSE